MKPTFITLENGTCGISVVGLELEDGQYTEEITNEIGEFRYEDMVTINVLQSITSDGEYTIKEVAYNLHTGKDQSDFTFTSDGLYEITHILIPTIDWINLQNSDLFAKVSWVYYYDNGEIKKMYNDEISGMNTIQNVNIQELLDVNPESPDESGYYPIMYKDCVGSFCLCKLTECFHKLCRQLLSDFCGKCINKLNPSKELMYNRDLIWMAINAIKYAIELNQGYEAQRILESLDQCGGICGKLESQKSGNCGCSGQS